MLKLLLKKQIGEIFRSYFYDAKKNKARSKGATTGFIIMFVVLMVAVLGGMFAALCAAVYPAAAENNMTWLYYAITGTTAVMLGCFGSIFNTYSGLYLSKDNDLLLSMPIKVRDIIISRVASVYIVGLMYSGVITVPAAIVAVVMGKTTFLSAAGAILNILNVSLIVLALSCILGWIVAKVSLKLKNKSFITVLISLVFFGLYYFVCFRAQSLISAFVENVEYYGEKIKSVYPLYVCGRAAAGEPVELLCVTAAAILLVLLVGAVISRSFIKIATSTGKQAKVKYDGKSEKVKSVNAALLAREFAHLKASPNYMLNCCLGAVLLPIIGIVLIVKSDTLLSLFNDISVFDCGSILACAVAFAVISTVGTAIPSVSLEGKTLWLMRSLPVKTESVLKAKLKVQLWISVLPAAIFVCLASVAFKLNAFKVLAFALCVILYTVFMGVECMLLGLNRPNLNWTSEITAIKQNINVLFAMLLGIAAASVFAILYFAVASVIPAAVYMIIFALCFGLLARILYRRLMKKGKTEFESL